ncbi:MAG: 1-acyl-sn-glycerol-3-phosphate acyltransferase [Ruminococcaceae bacterium]|nr:1-acyl-sn-glycerol-3-phosphate acyltransferase [Oscillospiraceae bacterium]
MTGLYRFALQFLTPFLYLFFRVKVEGKENIVRKGNVIFVSNHISFLDPFAIILTGRLHVRPLAKKELYKCRVIGFLLEKLGCVKVDRLDGITAFSKAKKSLLAGEDVMIFPEGTRSKTRELLDLKPGAAMLSRATGVPIQPVQIIAPKGVRLFSRIKIKFGKQMDMSLMNIEGDRDFSKANQHIKSEFEALRAGEMP